MQEFRLARRARGSRMAIGTTIHNLDFSLSENDRRRHLYLIGATGTGKTTTLVNLIAQDLQTAGLSFFDPHGDAAETILHHIPKSRIRHITYLDPSDLKRPIGYNILENVEEELRPVVADGVVAAFHHVFAESWGPRLEHFLLNGVRTLMDLPDADLLGLPLLFLNDSYRRKMLKKVRDPVVRMFWEDEFASYSERFLSEALSPILNKVGRVLSSPAIRNILCQPSTINLRHIMDEQKVLIVNLSKGKIGEGNAHLLGALLITGIAQAALSRQDTQHRPVHHIYADEFQNFATDSFALILSEARKYGLTLTLANQFLDQAPEQLRKAVFANVGSFLSFRVGAEDAPIIARHLGLKNTEQLQDLRNFHAIGKFLIDGTPSNPIHLSMSDLPPVAQSYAEQVKSHSRHSRARDRRVVEDRINRFLKPKDASAW